MRRVRRVVRLETGDLPTILAGLHCYCGHWARLECEFYTKTSGFC